MIPENWAESPPPQWGNNFLTPDLSISGNFEQLWFCGRKAPPHPHMRENFLTPDLSISGNFEQLWFLWQKSPPPPPPHEGKIFDTRSINFREFWATLVLVAEKPTPHPDEGIFFDTRSIHFRQFWATLVLVAENLPSPMRENFLTPDLSISGNFEQLWFWWKKRPPRWGKKFWHQIYPFQAISSNFGFGGRKAPPQMRGNFFTLDLSTSDNFEQLWFLWQKSPPLFCAFSWET